MKKLFVILFAAATATGYAASPMRLKNDTARKGATDTVAIVNLPGIIAHRGFWNASPVVPHNSMASFRNAQRQGFYAAEADFYATTDDRIVSFHDAHVPGFPGRIDTYSYDDLKDYRLANGERLPLLSDYLTAMADDPATKLIIEIKSHSTAESNNRAADLIAAAVKAAGLEGQVEYIAFDYDLCKYLASHPDIPAGTTVGYLNGDKAPAEVNADGIDCVDYSKGAIRSRPGMVREAHDLGMKVNVWTIVSEDEMAEFIDLGVDYITTDNPDVLRALYTNRK